MRKRMRSMAIARRLALLSALSGAIAMLFASSAAGAAIPGATYNGSVPGVGNETISFDVSGDGESIESVDFPSPIEAFPSCVLSISGTVFFEPGELPIESDGFEAILGISGHPEAFLEWWGEFPGAQTAEGGIELYDDEVGCDSGELFWSASTTATPPSPSPSPSPSPPPPTPPVSTPPPTLPVPGSMAKGKATGRAVVNGVARVRAGKALLRMRCPGTAACKGVAKLLFDGFRRVLVGKSSFTIPAGKSRTVRVRLNGKGKRLLRHARRHRLRVQLKGQGLKPRTVLLK